MKTCKRDEAMQGKFSAIIQPFFIIFCKTEFQATQLKCVRMPHWYQSLIQSVVVELECEGDHEKLRHACPDKSSEARPQKSIKSRPTHLHIRTLENTLNLDIPVNFCPWSNDFWKARVIANLCIYWMKYPNFEIVEQIQMPKEKLESNSFAHLYYCKNFKDA